jgi:hypothetical protein
VINLQLSEVVVSSRLENRFEEACCKRLILFVVSLTFASWNRIADWLRQIDRLSPAA